MGDKAAERSCVPRGSALLSSIQGGTRCRFSTPTRRILTFSLVLVSCGWYLGWVYRLYAVEGLPRAESDFNAFYSTVKVAEKGGSVYTAHKLQKQLPYFYPPFLLFIVKPLTALAFPEAFLVWNLLQVLMIFAVSLAAVKILEQLDLSARYLIGAASLIVFSLFVIHNLKWGQANILACALTWISVCLLVRRRMVCAGALLGAAVSIKLTPVVFLLLLPAFGFKRSLRFLAGLGASVLFCCLFLPGVAFGFRWSVDTNLAFVDLTARILSKGVRALPWGNNCANHSLFFLLQAWFGKCGHEIMRLTQPTVDSIYACLKWYILLLLAASTVGLFLKSNRRLLSLVIIQCALATILLNPFMWSHHLVMLIPAAALNGGLLFSDLKGRWTRALCLVSAVILWGTTCLGYYALDEIGLISLMLFLAWNCTAFSYFVFQAHYLQSGRQAKNGQQEKPQ